MRVAGIVGWADEGRVPLTRCRVTQLEPNPLPTLTAAELSAAFARNGYPDETVLFVTGEVESLTPVSQFEVRAGLKVPGGLGVAVSVEPHLARPLKVGAAARFKARCRGLSDDRKTVTLIGHPLPVPTTPLPLARE